jgi:hypothetical protein
MITYVIAPHLIYTCQVEALNEKQAACTKSEKNNPMNEHLLECIEQAGDILVLLEQKVLLVKEEAKEHTTPRQILLLPLLEAELQCRIQCLYSCTRDISPALLLHLLLHLFLQL